MIGSIIVWGHSLEDRKLQCDEIVKKSEKSFLKKDIKTHPDVFIIERNEEKKSIGIDEVRPIIKFLSQKPFSSKIKAVVIYEGEKLTVEAQNALLKTLEEPPSYGLIVLGSKNENSLIDTVISRCRKVATEKVSEKKLEADTATELINSDLKTKFEWAEENAKSEKEEVIAILEDMIRSQRTLLAKNSKNAANIRKIIKIKTDIERTNVNVRLALEYLITSLE